MDLKNSPDIVQAIAADVKRWISNESSDHDWWHIYRVWKLAKHLAREEGAKETITEMAALLHESTDPKLKRPFDQSLHKYLSGFGLSEEDIVHIETIIQETSFKGAMVDTPVSSPESACVQDADRLDAIGAIGIARTFTYGGHVGQPIHDPTLTPFMAPSEKEYRQRRSTTINHFYEKLLLLKDRMNTQTGKLYAEKRHAFMIAFLQQFQKEWNLES
jgi:uncharacterized protein